MFCSQKHHFMSQSHSNVHLCAFCVLAKCLPLFFLFLKYMPPIFKYYFCIVYEQR